MTGRDIVDDIDALIDSQLDAGEPIGGYDYNDPDYPKCWHCGRDWHGLPITERMNEMRWRGEMDPDYRYADDTSRVVCPGSEFIGPLPENQLTASVCQCTWCRLRRSRQQVIADLTRDIGVWPSMRDPLDPSSWLGSNRSAPWVTWREPARWWRLDIPAHRHLEDIEFELIDREQNNGWTPWGARPDARFTLVMRVGAGLAQIQGITTLDPDRENDLNYAFHTYDATRRPLTLDVHAERPNDMGGRIVWHEIDGPGGDYVRSRSVVSASRLDQWFDDRGLWFLAPREFRTAVDRLLDTVGFVPWQRELVNRWVSSTRRGERAIPDGAPYLPAGVSVPQRGDTVGYEIGGRVYTGVVTSVDPGPRGDDTVLSLDGTEAASFDVTFTNPAQSLRRLLFGLASDGGE
ncbi:hypothetical protein SEA_PHROSTEDPHLAKE_80 [Gordonia phage PhrostedPhlake]|nr:hypothetical protein SEA_PHROSTEDPHLAKE_80 [Gordonia phage PhrostedPhlake]